MNERWRDFKKQPDFVFKPWMRTVDDLQDQISELVATLEYAKLQLEYLDTMVKAPVTPIAIARIATTIAKVESES